MNGGILGLLLLLKAVNEPTFVSAEITGLLRPSDNQNLGIGTSIKIAVHLRTRLVLAVIAGYKDFCLWVVGIVDPQ